MKKLFLDLLVLSLFLLQTNCNNPENSDYDEFIRVSEEENGTIPFSNIQGIDIENSRGGVIIYGTTRTDTIFYVLSKTINARTKDIAETYFEDIKLDYYIEKDTLRSSVQYPFDTDNLNTSGYLDLYIPLDLPVTINNMVEGIYVYYMANDIFIHNVKDHIEIKYHSGSCNVQTQKGDIRLEIAIPDSGYCIAKTDNGDIKLTIPRHTSANIYIKTYSGLIIYQKLDISNLIQTSNSLSGILGTGDGEIRLETNIGNISIEILDID